MHQAALVCKAWQQLSDFNRVAGMKASFTLRDLDKILGVSTVRTSNCIEKFEQPLRLG